MHPRGGFPEVLQLSSFFPELEGGPEEDPESAEGAICCLVTHLQIIGRKRMDVTYDMKCFRITVEENLDMWQSTHAAFISIYFTLFKCMGYQKSLMAVVNNMMVAWLFIELYLL